MKITSIASDILNEQFAEPEEPISFGTNAPRYDNKQVGYKGSVHSFVTVVVPEEGVYIPILVHAETGLVRFTYTENANIANMLTVRTYFRDAIVLTAFPYINQIFFGLFAIIRKYNNRLDTLAFRAITKRLNVRLRYVLRSPFLRMFLKQRRFNYEGQVPDTENKLVYYVYKKA